MIGVLTAAGAHPTQARAFAPALMAAFPRFGFTTRERQAAFIGQVMIESTRLTELEEGLSYKTLARLREVFRAFRTMPDAQARAYLQNPKGLANFVYAGRNGNGPEASGDGWRYRGRGLKQLTGRANYSAAALRLGRPYVEQPDLVALPEDAVLTACAFCVNNPGFFAAADAQDWDGVTRIVNGPGMVQAAERARASRAALRAMAEGA